MTPMVPTWAVSYTHLGDLETLRSRDGHVDGRDALVLSVVQDGAEQLALAHGLQSRSGRVNADDRDVLGSVASAVAYTHLAAGRGRSGWHM